MTQVLVMTFMLLAQLLSSRTPAVSGSVDVRADRTVNSPTLSLVTLMPNSQEIEVGSSACFQAIGTFSDGSIADLTQSVIWTGSPEAMVIAPGHVRALAPSIATVSVSTGQLVASASLVAH